MVNFPCGTSSYIINRVKQVHRNKARNNCFCRKYFFIHSKFEVAKTMNIVAMQSDILI